MQMPLHVVCRLIYMSLSILNGMVEHGIIPKSIKTSFMIEEDKVKGTSPHGFPNDQSIS